MIKRLILALMVSIGIAFGQNQQSPPQPFFFPKGFYQTTDPLRQREEYIRWMSSTWGCNQRQAEGVEQIIPGSDSITIQTDVLSTDSVTENPTKMKLFFDHYVKMPDGKIRYTDMCHSELITPEQFKVVSDGLKQLAVSAAQRDFEFYSKTYDRIISVRAEKLGMPKDAFVKILDEKIPGEEVTYREVNHLPKPMQVSDFVPRELHLGFNPEINGILGVTWFNTGVIYYNPSSWITDYLNGVPKVMQHEEVHGNINLEKWPMNEAFDVELMASLPEMLYPENQTDFPSHSYASDIREMAQIYFGMDWDEMNKQIEKFDFAGNIVYNDEKYLYYYNQIALVKAEMLKLFNEVSIPEFYSDPLWWGAVNNIRGDNNSVFRVTLADHYQICSLGGCEASQEWLNTHKDEILDIAKDAFQAGMNSRGGSEESEEITPWMIEQYNRIFTPAERTIIEAYFRAHPEQLKNLRMMTPAEAVKFMQRFKTPKEGAIR
jgi:hypothetical protein